MASSYSEDLTCPICLTIFSDPVVLRCGHSFCRECISLSLKSQPQCPQCRVPEKGQFTSNHILKSLSEKAKENERSKRGSGADEAAGGFCPEHDEKLKLFCFTDQQLVCIICRDGEKHEGHKFKPVKEAAALVRKELEAFLQQASSDIVTIEETANKQRDQLTKTKAKSQQLTSQISSQFEEMHRFLNKREEEIKKELKQKEEAEVNEMMDTLTKAEAALSEGVEMDRQVRAFLETSDPEKLLKSWSEDNTMCSFRPRGINLQVVRTSLSMGPFESHLQFFVWKEMLQVVQPRAELLTLRSDHPDVGVSGDGRSLVCKTTINPPQSFAFASSGSGASSGSRASSGFGTSSGSRAFSGFGTANVREDCFYGQNGSGLFGTTQTGGFLFGRHTTVPVVREDPVVGRHALGVSAFTSGQHYWEIETGCRNYWEIGIQGNFLKYEGGKYGACGSNKTTELALASKPRKIGVYLNCPSEKLSFYDADNMTHIHTTRVDVSSPVSSLVAIRQATPYDPVTVCWY